MPKEVPCESSNAPERVYIPKAPYPQALKNGIDPFKKGASIEQMMKTFGEVKINIPLLEAIKQIPAYGKFLKDLCTQKRNQVKNLPKRVFMAEQASAMIQNACPRKYKDPGSPTISCIIGEQQVDRALLDLGAGVNVIPYATYEKLGLGNLQPTPITLELADRSVRFPRGVVEDVLVQVDKFIFPVDFVVLDMDSEKMARNPVPIILGRPFLATANATINCRTGLMKISFGNMKVHLNIFKGSNAPFNHDSNKINEVYCLNAIDTHVEITPSVLGKTPLESCLDNMDWDAFDADAWVEMLETIDPSDGLLEDLPSLKLEPSPVSPPNVGVEDLGRGSLSLTIRHIHLEVKAMQDEYPPQGKVPKFATIHPLYGSRLWRRKPRLKRRMYASVPLGERRLILRDPLVDTFVRNIVIFVSHLLFIFQPKRRKVIGELALCEST